MKSSVGEAMGKAIADRKKKADAARAKKRAAARKEHLPGERGWDKGASSVSVDRDVSRARYARSDRVLSQGGIARISLAASKKRKKLAALRARRAAAKRDG